MGRILSLLVSLQQSNSHNNMYLLWDLPCLSIFVFFEIFLLIHPLPWYEIVAHVLKPASCPLVLWHLCLLHYDSFTIIFSSISQLRLIDKVHWSFNFLLNYLNIFARHNKGFFLNPRGIRFFFNLRRITRIHLRFDWKSKNSFEYSIFF